MIPRERETEEREERMAGRGSKYQQQEKRQQTQTLATTNIYRAVLKSYAELSVVYCIEYRVYTLYADNIRTTENIKYENSAFRRHTLSHGKRKAEYRRVKKTHKNETSTRHTM